MHPVSQGRVGVWGVGGQPSTKCCYLLPLLALRPVPGFLSAVTPLAFCGGPARRREAEVRSMCPIRATFSAVAADLFPRNCKSEKTKLLPDFDPSDHSRSHDHVSRCDLNPSCITRSILSPRSLRSAFIPDGRLVVVAAAFVRVVPASLDRVLRLLYPFSPSRQSNKRANFP